MSYQVAFLDTSYVYALLNSRDRFHQAAVELEASLASERCRLVTTEFVLVEIADGLSSLQFRTQAVNTIEILQQSPLMTIVPASSDLFQRGLKLYKERSDKDWGITDCISFVVMQERGITAALTADAHYRQAGFQPLLSSAAES
jgi:predicted nucleic acid-binding protein